MDHSKAVIAARWPRLLALACLLVLGATGCAFVKLKMREPGHHNQTFPDSVAAEYHCDKRPLPFYQLESSEVVPRKIQAGKEINQRLIYVLCPDRPTAVIPGTLHTRVLFEGDALVDESVEHKLRPGRWVLDSFIELPADANPGLYAVEVVFESASGGESLHANTDFIVKSR